MAKRTKKQRKRVRNLALVCTLTTVVLVASTFAWFIGMRTVNVNSFDVTIAAIDGLSLSLDGETWSETLSVGKAETAYDGNTNTWADSGLIPVSSVGVVDTKSSTLKLYEKASLTPTKGGYRLLASRVNNYEADDNGKYNETKGYVAFDLFIKNLSGTEYYTENNVKNEEAIYLTNDSAVTVATSGVKDTGIENSVRVAFAPIGRIIATNTDKDLITGLSCTSVEDEDNAKNTTTGICRTATIWEPNDRDHVEGAIEHYEASCKKRTAADTYGTEACSPLVDGLAKQTYAIKDVINYKDEGGQDVDIVDVYDGTDYNGYAITGSNLEAFDTFTDSEKLQTGTARQEFLTLAPNSITKVRVYVYIEGQDVDNYDYAQVGKKIAVKFGFTKQRFNEEDTNYTGPITNEGDGPFVWDEDTGAYVQATDTTKPFIKLSGEGVTNDTLNVTLNDELELDTKVTAKAYDKVSTFTKTNVEGEDVYTVETVTETELDSDTYPVTHTGTVNTKVAGTYQVVYSVKDAAGNLGTKVLTVVVSE